MVSWIRHQDCFATRLPSSFYTLSSPCLHMKLKGIFQLRTAAPPSRLSYHQVSTTCGHGWTRLPGQYKGMLQVLPQPAVCLCNPTHRMLHEHLLYNPPRLVVRFPLYLYRHIILVNLVGRSNGLLGAFVLSADSHRSRLYSCSTCIHPDCRYRGHNSRQAMIDSTPGKQQLNKHHRLLLSIKASFHIRFIDCSKWLVAPHADAASLRPY